jgi:ABC-type nitrate/sulfonate/bicarbonate transport system substrate-binding protein
VELVNGFKLGEPLNTAGYTVTRSYLKDNGDSVRKFLKAYADAWAYTASATNKAEVVKAIQKYTESDAEAAEAGYESLIPVWQGKKVPTVDPAGITNILALSSEPKAKQAKPSDFIDNSLLEAAVK